MADERLRQLERRVAVSNDPDAKKQLKLQRMRMGLGRPFIPRETMSRRTRKRWKAHQNLTCNDKCRFCRPLRIHE